MLQLPALWVPLQVPQTVLQLPPPFPLLLPLLPLNCVVLPNRQQHCQALTDLLLPELMCLHWTLLLLLLLLNLALLHPVCQKTQRLRSGRKSATHCDQSLH